MKSSIVIKPALIMLCTVHTAFFCKFTYNFLGYVKKIKKPKKVKDHTVLANIVIVFDVCPFMVDRNWLKTLMIQSTQYPEVSGFYKLLSKTLCEGREFFKKNSDLFHTCTQFLTEVIEKCHRFEHELLISFLKMITQLPLEFVRCLLPYLSIPMLKVFSIKSHLDLVEQGIDAIENWNNAIGHDTISDLLI